MKKKKVKYRSTKNPTQKKEGRGHSSNAWWRDKKILTYLLAGLALTLIVYIPSFSADFVNWDDGEYVQNNGMITSFSNFKRIWTTPIAGNYHPLTMLTLMINYAISAKSAFGYHVTNVLLHLLNVVLVFHFIYLLSDKKWLVALITAVLFGIHPMHVESVAWISERKDVLFTAFFMGSLIQYLKYLSKGNRKHFVMSLVLCALSLLSKPAAVALPVTLVLIDWFKQRKLFQSNVLLEKLPFFVLAIGMGVLTILVQTDRGAVADLDLIPLSRKLFFACYGLMMYLGKLLVPINLAAFYPFPSANIAMPIMYYISPIVVVLIAALTYFVSKKWSRAAAFGMLFFLINIALVLQVISIGSAVMADRYTYVPFIGCFFIIGYGFHTLLQSKNKYANIATGLLVLYVLGMTFLGYQQTKTWNNSSALWNHAIAVWPSAHAYTNRALDRRGAGDLEGSLKDYNMAISMHSGDPTSYTNRGNIYFAREENELAIQDYNKAIKLSPSDPKTFANRGAAFSKLNKFDLAISDFSRAIELDQNYGDAYKNRALTYDAMEQPANALLDYTSFLKLHPRNHATYNMRALAYNKLGQLQNAADDLTKAIALNGSITMYYQNRSILHKALGRKAEALADAQKVLSLGGQLPNGYLESLR